MSEKKHKHSTDAPNAHGKLSAGSKGAGSKSEKGTPTQRCPHCGYRYAPKEVSGPVKLCPQCKMTLEDFTA